MTARTRRNEVNSGENFYISVFLGGVEVPRVVPVPRVGWRDALSKIINDPSKFDRWSPILWRRGARRNSFEFMSCDFLVIDVDGGLAVRDAVLRLKALDALVVATRRHGLAIDGGLPADRYRVIVPFESTVRSLAAFKSSMRAGAAAWPEADHKCLDAARFYWIARREVLFSNGGAAFPTSSPSKADIETAHVEIHGCGPGALRGFNRSAEPIRRIKIPGFGNTSFDMHRPHGSPEDTYRKSIRVPIRLGRDGLQRWMWLPSMTPVFERVPVEATRGGSRRFARGRLIGEDVRGRGLLAIELAPSARARDFAFLHGMTTRHPGGRRLWLRYEVDAATPRETEAMVARLCDTIRLAIVRRGLSDFVKWNASLSPRRRVPAIPSEIAALMSGRRMRFLDLESARRVFENAIDKSPIGAASATCAHGSRFGNAERPRAGSGRPVGDGAEPTGRDFDRVKQATLGTRRPGGTRVDPEELPPAVVRGRWHARAIVAEVLSHPRLFRGAKTGDDGWLEVRSFSFRLSAPTITARLGANERRVRRVIDGLVRDGFLRRVGEHRPGRIARTYEATQTLFSALTSAGLIVGEDGKATGFYPPENVSIVTAADPATLGPPVDGEFNAWIWRAAWMFSEEAEFWSWLSNNHQEFLDGKPDREGLARDSWRRRIARRVEGAL